MKFIFSRFSVTLDNKSVFVKSLIQLITLISLVVLLGSSIYYVSIKSYFLDEITKNNEQLMKQAIATYEVFLDSTIKAAMVYMEHEDSNAVSLAADNYFENNDRIYSRLNNISKISDFIYSIYYFNKDPESIYVSSGFSFDRSDFYDREWIATLDSVKDFYILPARKLPTITGDVRDVIPIVINFPLNSATHLYTYVINLDAGRLFNYLIKNIEANKEKSFKIIDQTGMIIISTDNPDHIFRNIREFPFIKPSVIMTGSEGNFQTARDGEKLLVSYFTSPSYGWRYVCTVNFASVSQNMLKPLKVILIISLLLLSLSILVAVMISKRLYKPVNDIMHMLSPDEGCRNKNEYEVIRRHLNKYLNENRHLQSVVNENLPAIKKQFLYSLIARNIFTKEEAQEKLKYFNIMLGNCFTVLLLEIDNIESYLNRFTLEDRMLWEFAMENISAEILRQNGTGFFISMEANRFAVVYSSDASNTPEEAERNVSKLAYEMKEAIRNFLGFTVTIGAGKMTEDITALYGSYQEAVTALKFKESIGNDEVILFTEVCPASTLNVNYPHEIEKSLLQYLMMGDAGKSVPMVRSLFGIFKNQKYVHKSQLQVFAFQLLTALMKQIIELDIPEEEIFMDNRDFSSLTGLLIHVNHEEECIEIFGNIVAKLCDHIDARRKNTSNSQVKIIVGYINENYSQPISMDIIADYTGLNRCYVGRLFKQYLHVSMVDFINQVRIGKAVELLDGTALKVHEIAAGVGFNNTHYFIKMFKKLMHMTPGQYKEQLGKGEE